MLARIGYHFGDVDMRYSSVHDQRRAVVEWLFRLTDEGPEVRGCTLHTKHAGFLEIGIPVYAPKSFWQMRAMVYKGMNSAEVRRMEQVVAADAVYGGPKGCDLDAPRWSRKKASRSRR